MPELSVINIRDDDLTEELIREHLTNALDKVSGDPSSVVELWINPNCYALEDITRELSDSERKSLLETIEDKPNEVIGYFDFIAIRVTDDTHPSRIRVMSVKHAKAYK